MLRIRASAIWAIAAVTAVLSVACVLSLLGVRSTLSGNKSWSRDAIIVAMTATSENCKDKIYALHKVTLTQARAAGAERVHHAVPIELSDTIRAIIQEKDALFFVLCTPNVTVDCVRAFACGDIGSILQSQFVRDNCHTTLYIESVGTTLHVLVLN